MNTEQATITYQGLAGILEAKLYPKMQAIANGYEEALRQDKDAKKVNPMELWGLHHLWRLDHMGFRDELSGRRNAASHDHATHSKEFESKVTASRAVGSVDCDD